MNRSNRKETEVGTERFGPEAFHMAKTEQECQLGFLCCVDPLWIGSKEDLAEFNRGTRLVCAIALVVAMPWLWLFVGMPT